MKLSHEAITSLIAIYEQEFGVLIGEQEANKKGIELLEFMKIIYKPVPTVYAKRKLSLATKK